MPSEFDRDPSQDADPLARLEPEVRLTVNERLTLVYDAIERYGEGFLAWVIRFPELAGEPAMVDHFRSTYCGWYYDRASFMADQLDALDWRARIDELSSEYQLPPGALLIQPEGFWKHCTDVFAVEERLGGVHVFAI